ncbi:two pore channel protein 2-like [Ptychodera flava]|uniref:two pore channel protein 2-like n=1 Tax=Ptychodera flava TaxID=63121 RepID=UPI003969E8F0
MSINDSETDPMLSGTPYTIYDGDVTTPSIQHSRWDRENDIDPSTIKQAVVFLEDAINYRSIKHKIDSKSLRLYQWYYSIPVQWCIYVTITVILILAFFEEPSSITTGFTSDPRYRGDRLDPPCALTESIEVLCLSIFLTDVFIKTYLVGRKQFFRSKWLIAYVVVVGISFIDLFVSLSLSCDEVVRIRRLLRPFFLLQNSSLMKKTVRSIKRTLPEVFSVILLLLLHLYIFTIFGMLLFPKPTSTVPLSNTTVIEIEAEQPDHFYTNEKINKEGSLQFSSLTTSFMSLLVLLTTANNPDVMMPAYTANRFYALYFILFLVIGMYFFLNMLTAVIYNQFRGYLQSSMQASFFRRRLAIRAAFEVLRCGSTRVHNPGRWGVVPVNVTRTVVMKCKMSKSCKKAIIRELDTDIGGSLNASQFRDVFDELDKDTTWTRQPEMRTIVNPYLKKIQYCIAHHYFDYFGNLMALINVICITVELAVQYEQALSNSDSKLASANFIFVLYYLFEMIIKLWALGFRCYAASKSNIFDAIVTIALTIVQIWHSIMYGAPFAEKEDNILPDGGKISLWDLFRIINMLIVFRLLRVIPKIRSMRLVTMTLIDLLKNMKAFAGILVVIYYFFAILGIEFFAEVIDHTACQGNNTFNHSECTTCGTYQELEYWPNNFDDFAAALVVLWDLMVVNNWQVFLQAYSAATTPWSQLYFIAWYFTSVLICINLFTALILENFITKWDRHQQQVSEGLSESEMTTRTTVHSMFRDMLKEPTESELLKELQAHHPQLQLGL